MLDTERLEQKKQFLIRELTRYGGICNPVAYKFVERDIMADTNGAEEEEMLGVLDFLRGTYCGGNFNE